MFIILIKEISEYFNYDANRNLIHTVDSKGNEKFYEYDFSGNLIRIKNIIQKEDFSDEDEP